MKKVIGKKNVLLAALVLSAFVLPLRADYIWTPLENFEGYADTTQMRAEAPLYAWTADGGSTSFNLATNTANTGDQSMYCKLSPTGWGMWNVFGLRYYDGNGINLLDYDAVSMSLRGSSSLAANNTVTAIKFQVADRYGSLLIDQTLDLSWATSNDWHTITVDIDDRWNWAEVRWIGLRVQRGQYQNPDFWLDDFQVGVVPEPATLSLLGFGALILAKRRK